MLLRGLADFVEGSADVARRMNHAGDFDGVADDPKKDQVGTNGQDAVAFAEIVARLDAVWHHRQRVYGLLKHTNPFSGGGGAILGDESVDVVEVVARFRVN